MLRLPIRVPACVPIRWHGTRPVGPTGCLARHPPPPGIFILDDGIGLVAKRLDLVASGTSATRDTHHLQITSENAQYARYQRDIDEVHIVWRVVWFARAL